MNFKVLPVNSDVKNQEGGFIYLVSDDWNDWWKYRVLYHVYLKGEDQEVILIGSVKIGQFGMESKQDRVSIPPSFVSLTDQFNSLGQDSYYYENLNLLGDEFRDAFLQKMKDIALDANLYDKVRSLDVTIGALMRDIKHSTLKDIF